MAETDIIPRATAQRLPIYQHHLKSLQDAGEKSTSSQEIALALKFDPATVRRDFSFFGELGKRGLGYKIDALVEFFAQKLNDVKQNNVILVGAGNIGSALAKFNFYTADNVNVVAAFDINPAVTVVNDEDKQIPVYSMGDLVAKNKEIGAEFAILAVPESAAQEATDVLVEAGIKGILNFTPLRVNVPKDVFTQNVDLTREMQSLIYFVDNKDSIKSI
ncbi:MAG: redox-sensing transcriptional repressor Rex [Lactobacillaceae bacterium]|jgi:redox-sensing transcriptional repressor|nr:redox-sensing transcriptional repressor Rex [Lactobacillaceae bacterium]